MVLRSHEALAGVPSAGAVLPLDALGSTFTMAQEATWIDDEHFAVGRWDGSLSIFRFEDAATLGPKIAVAVNSPAEEGVQMITPLQGASPTLFCSNDDRSIVQFAAGDGDWSRLTLARTLGYDAAFGVANSGAVVNVRGSPWLVTGHANGRLLIWSAGPEDQWAVSAVVDLRAPRPVNPWGMTNIRAVEPLPSTAEDGFVIAGSEDGNLTVVRIPDGKVMSAAIYNPNAQRGINSVAAWGERILVANCAVGPMDSNLWAYRVDPETWTITNTAKANLAVDPTQPQIFNFDVVWAVTGDGAMPFFCSTQEGALWMGELSEDGSLQILGHELVTAQLGSALCRRDARLAVVGYDLKQFKMHPVRLG